MIADAVCLSIVPEIGAINAYHFQILTDPAYAFMAGGSGGEERGGSIRLKDLQKWSAAQLY